ncbi:MAG: hypothetical protein NTY38_07245 [Acidobacteria bacterium]|nr:hypothetical protein [Acidobacteriota bacterium]
MAPAAFEVLGIDYRAGGEDAVGIARARGFEPNDRLFHRGVDEAREVAVAVQFGVLAEDPEGLAPAVPHVGDEVSIRLLPFQKVVEDLAGVFGVACEVVGLREDRTVAQVEGVVVQFAGCLAVLAFDEIASQVAIGQAGLERIHHLLFGH